MLRGLFFLIFSAVIIAIVGASTGRLQKKLTIAQRRVWLAQMAKLIELKEPPAGSPIELQDVFLQERAGFRVVWLDMRPRPQRAISWIPGSLPYEGFVTDRYDMKKTLIVIYDSNGWDSLEAAKYQNLKKGWHGVVRSLVGGMLAWAQAGRTFDGPSGAIKTLTVPSGLWNLAPDDYRAIW